MKDGKGRLENACRQYEEDLVLYHYGEGSPAERNRIEAHAAQCERCERFLADLEKLLPQIAKPKELPAAFWDNYYQEMVEKLAAQRERRAWWRRLFAPTGPWVVPAFGTAVIAVIALGLVLGKGVPNFHRARLSENIPREILADANQLEFFDSMDILESLRALEALDGTRHEPAQGQRS